MRYMIIILLFLSPTLLFAVEPTIDWGLVGVGHVSHTGPAEESSKHFFVMGSILADQCDRLTAHAMVKGKWVENPHHVHVEPLTKVREDGTRGFVIQIPETAVDDTNGLELFISLVVDNSIIHTFSSKIIQQQDGVRADYVEGGQPLPLGTVLEVVEVGTIGKRHAPRNIPKINHIVPEGQREPEEVR